MNFTFTAKIINQKRKKRGYWHGNTEWRCGFGEEKESVMRVRKCEADEWEKWFDNAKQKKRRGVEGSVAPGCLLSL